LDTIDPNIEAEQGESGKVASASDRPPVINSNQEAPADSHRKKPGRKAELLTPEAEAERARQRLRYAARKEREANAGNARAQRLLNARPRQGHRPQLPPPDDPVPPQPEVIHVEKTSTVIHARRDFSASADVATTLFFTLGRVVFGNEFAPDPQTEKEEVRRVGAAFKEYFEVRNSALQLPPEVMLATALLAYSFQRISARPTMTERAGRVWSGFKDFLTKPRLGGKGRGPYA
jgi:hypothetical protein